MKRLCTAVLLAVLFTASAFAQSPPNTAAMVPNTGVLPAGPWTPYTPTLSCVTGTLTTASATGRYQTIGKITFVEISAALTTVGTCASGVIATLPGGVTAAAGYVLTGRETAITGNMMFGYIASGATSVNMQYYNSTFSAANGDTIFMSGVMEAQ